MDLSKTNLSDIPEILRPLLINVCEGLSVHEDIQALLEKDEKFSESFLCVLSSSKFVTDIMRRYPAHLPELVEKGRLQRRSNKGELEQIFAAPNESLDTEVKKLQQMRSVRHRELVRITWRDIAGWASIEETLNDLTDLANASVCNALDWCINDLSERFGEPLSAEGVTSQFIVLAMGKLGGGELNFSSDIDLVLLYSEPGSTNGRREVSNEEYFRSLSQRFINLLDKKTAAGFVYRVDVRLRPFGNSGALALSTAGLENYLMQHGRNWERYAYLKARVVNDWDGANNFYEEILRPFVYRRYTDYGVFSALREIKTQIEKESRSHLGNIKLGPGGIREIEFIIQSLQLVRGGTVEGLRERSFFKALPQLVKYKCLAKDAADELENSYKFLRKLENSIQEIADQQTQELPTSEVDQARVYLAMGYSEWNAVIEDLNIYRATVERHFRDILLQGADDPSADTADSGLRNLWSEEHSDDAALDQLKTSGFRDPEGSLELIKRLRDSSVYRYMDETGRQRVDRLVPAIIDAAAENPMPGRALEGALRVIESIGRRSAYFALLIENPGALKHLVSLSAKSKILATQLATYPALLDELLDPRIFSQVSTREEISSELRTRLEAVHRDDPEARLVAVRNFQEAAVFRVSVADLSGSFPVMKVADQLTDIAELVLQEALDIAWDELTRRHGKPFCTDENGERPAEFIIVGYGKLGGIELGYGSDLDVVFVHDSSGQKQQTNGEKQLDNTTFFARLAKRLVSILTMQTISGRLYEVDTRLRPSGRSGLLVTSLTAFEQYQNEDAWTWEHQALLRSRPVAGNKELTATFNDLRTRVLQNSVRRENLKNDVRTMRERMRNELSKGTADTFDIKQDTGGIGDIEFIVQYLILREAQTKPDLLRYSDNIRQIEDLRNAAIIIEEEARTLSDIYRAYRESINHLALAGRPGLISEIDFLAEEFSEFRQSITTLWTKYLHD